MTKFNAKWAAAALTALLGMSAWAGAKVSYYVSLSFGSSGGGSASAALGAVRNSTNSVEHMGCTLLTYGPSIGGGQMAYCSASDAGGTFVSCLTTDPGLTTAVRGIKGDSHLEFQWDAAGQCVLIVVTDDSTHEPKLP